MCASPEPMSDSERVAPDYAMPMSTEERRARWPWPLRPPEPITRRGKSSKQLLSTGPLCESPEPTSNSGAAGATLKKTANQAKQATGVRRPPRPPRRRVNTLSLALPDPFPPPPQPTSNAETEPARSSVGARFRLILGTKSRTSSARFRFTSRSSKLTELRPEAATRVRFAIDERGMARLNRPPETASERAARLLAKERRSQSLRARREMARRAFVRLHIQRAREARRAGSAIERWRARVADEEWEWEDESEEEDEDVLVARAEARWAATKANTYAAVGEECTLRNPSRGTKMVRFARRLPVYRRPPPKGVVLDILFPRGEVQKKTEKPKEPLVMITRTVLRSLSTPGRDTLPPNLNAEQRRIVKRAETRRAESILVPLPVEEKNGAQGRSEAEDKNSTEEKRSEEEPESAKEKKGVKEKGKQRAAEPQPRRPRRLATVMEEDEEEEIDVEEQYMLAVIFGLVGDDQPGGSGETAREKAAFIEEIDADTESLVDEVQKDDECFPGPSTSATEAPTKATEPSIIQDSPEKGADDLQETVVAEPNLAAGPSASTPLATCAKPDSEEDSKDDIPRIPWAAKGKWKAVSSDSDDDGVGMSVPYPHTPAPLTPEPSPDTPSSKMDAEPLKELEESAPLEKTSPSQHPEKTLPSVPSEETLQSVQTRKSHRPVQIEERLPSLQFKKPSIPAPSTEPKPSPAPSPAPTLASSAPQPRRQLMEDSPRSITPHPPLVTPPPPETEFAPGSLSFATPLAWNCVPIRMKPKPQWIPWANPRAHLQPVSAHALVPAPGPRSDDEDQDEDEDEVWHDCLPGPWPLRDTRMPSTPPPAYEAPMPRIPPLRWVPQVVGGEEPSQDRYAQYIARDLPERFDGMGRPVQDEAAVPETEEELPGYEEPAPEPGPEREPEMPNEGLLVRLRRRLSRREESSSESSETHVEEVAA